MPSLKPMMIVVIFYFIIVVLDVLYSSTNILIRDRVFLYDNTASFVSDLVKILLSVRPNLYMGSSWYISVKPGPVFTKKEERNEEFSVLFLGPTTFE